MRHSQLQKAPLLTIAIPTFNRADQLKYLYSNFLCLVTKNFCQQDIEIIVCDNSNSEVSQQNSQLFEGTKILYLKNEENIGFARNIVNCVKKGSGKFIWIISDDDEVEFTNFVAFFEWLKLCQNGDVDCVMLPFMQYKFGKLHIANTSKQWKIIETPTTLANLIHCANQLPFVLFSACVIKIENKNISDVDIIEKNFSENDFIQIALFIELIGLQGNVSFYDCYLQKYRLNKNIRFDIQSLNNSYIQMINWYCQKGKSLNKTKMLQTNTYRWLGWLLWDRIDLVNLPGANSFNEVLIKKLYFPLNFKIFDGFLANLKNLFLLIVLHFIPARILKFTYKYYNLCLGEPSKEKVKNNL